MENGLGAIEVTLRNHEARIEANHDSIARLRDKDAAKEVKIEVTLTEVREIRDDIMEFKGEMRWVKRGLWAASGTFLVFIVALITMIFQLTAG